MDFLQDYRRKDYNGDTDRDKGIRHIERRKTRHDKVREITIDKVDHHLHAHAINKVAHGTAQNHDDAQTTHPITLIDRLVEPQKNNGCYNRNKQEEYPGRQERHQVLRTAAKSGTLVEHQLKTNQFANNIDDIMIRSTRFIHKAPKSPKLRQLISNNAKKNHAQMERPLIYKIKLFHILLFSQLSVRLFNPLVRIEMHRG